MLASNRWHLPIAARWRVWSLALAAAFALPCAVQACSPDMLPSPGLWTYFNQKIYEKNSSLIYEEDTDHDGVNDYRIFRNNQDGTLVDLRLKPGANGMVPDVVVVHEKSQDKKNWVYGFSKKGDGQIDMIVRGQYAENKWNQMIYDSEHDNKAHTFLADSDENGVWDCMGVSTNGDGRFDYLYDLDNKTGAVINETIGWVTFKEQQRREALPLLYYSFVPEVKTLSGDPATIVSSTWDYGDETVRHHESLVTGEHPYKGAGTYDVQLDVEFKVGNSDKVWKAWYGISLPVVEGPAPAPPLTEEMIRASITNFYGLCGLVTSDEQPKTGTIAELWPGVKTPEAAPMGKALRVSAAAPGTLDLGVMWWRNEAEANAFLDSLAATPGIETQLPAAVVRMESAQPFEVVSKVRAKLLDSEKDKVRIAAWREGGFIITLTSNMPATEVQRWTRLLYEVLHPAPAKAPETATPAATTTTSG